MSDVLKSFWEINRMSVEPADESGRGGIRIPQFVSQNQDGTLNMFAMMMYGRTAPIDTFRTIIKHLIVDKPLELVFGLDRYAKPGQGIETADFFSVAYWNGEFWRFGVIQYDQAKGRFDPIDWSVRYWIDMLRKEFVEKLSILRFAPLGTSVFNMHPSLSVPLKVDHSQD